MTKRRAGRSRSVMAEHAARVVKALHISFMTSIFAGSVYIFGGLLIGTGQDIYYGWASRNWPATIGTVTSSYVERTRKSCIPHVSYRYELDERSIASSRLGNWWAYDNAYRFVEAFPAGAEVLVYHDPRGEVSVLERGVRIFDVVAFLIMVPFSTLMVLMYWGALSYFITEPAAEQLAQWRGSGYVRKRLPGALRAPAISTPRANALMEAEIAERLREQAARRGPGAH